MSTKNIPQLDLSDFLCDDNNLRNKFVKSLGKAYADIGFVAVKNHGIPENTIEKLYEILLILLDIFLLILDLVIFEIDELFELIHIETLFTIVVVMIDCK